MSRFVIAGLSAACAMALSGCASTGSAIQTAAFTSEQTETECENLYVAIATGINSFEALPTTSVAQKASAEGVKQKAWSDLQTVRAAYLAGQVVSAAALLADQTLVATTVAPAAGE